MLRYFAMISVICFGLAIGPPAHAEVNDSSQAALAIVQAARRQAVAASEIVTKNGGTQATADAAYSDVFLRAIREGVRLSNPSANESEQDRMVQLIGGASSVGISAEAIVLADSVIESGTFNDYDRFEAEKAFDATFVFAYTYEHERLRRRGR